MKLSDIMSTAPQTLTSLGLGTELVDQVTEELKKRKQPEAKAAIPAGVTSLSNPMSMMLFGGQISHGN